MKKFMFSCLMAWSVAFSLSAATIDLEKKWAPVIRAIAQVESEGNPKMVSKCGRYVGYLQISKILVRECNQILGKQVYTYDDRYDKQKSIDMFIVFQEHFNKEGNTEKAIRLWNSGDLNCMKHKRPTEGYYRRVMAKFTAQAQAME
ncbi:MAG: transglycosylase SLT domain-containing protein [Bacteroidaceae bacterium]|nr:transglycosylase SLT domain-containing protein [Bacteroidaceae bacterium]